MNSRTPPSRIDAGRAGRPPPLPDLPESEASLWRLTAGPAIWAGHFLACYLSAAVWCAKVGRDAPLGGLRTALAVATLLAMAGIVLAGRRGWHMHALGTGEVPHDADSPADRHRFLGFATVLLCGLSFVAVVYQALPLLVIGSCR